MRLRLLTFCAAILATGCGARSGLVVPGDDGPSHPRSGLGAACPGGWLDCNGDPSDGCETDTVSDANNCGACGVKCPPGQFCGAGQCHDGEDIVGIAVGEFSACALRARGEVLCWGGNPDGELGRGWGPHESTAKVVPGLDDVGRLAFGVYTICALRRDGELWCWGWDGYGEVGNGPYQPDAARPVRVFEDLVVADPNPSNPFACVLERWGTVACWGDPEHGALGDGHAATGAVFSRVQVAGLDDAVQAHDDCARHASGAVSCWGLNAVGEVGDGTTIDRSTPVVVPGVVASRLATKFAKRCAFTDAELLCWGDNTGGALFPAPGPVTTPQPLGVVDVAAITFGYDHACALLRSGPVVCWGSNNDGQLGAGDMSPHDEPVEVIGLDDAVAIDGGAGFTCALRASGRVSCWGLNEFSQLGNGSEKSHPSPVDVIGLP